LTKYKEAPAYFGVVEETLTSYDDTNADLKSLSAKMAIDIESVIGKRKIRDWVSMEDVIKAMENDIDDYLFDIKDEHSLPLSTADLDVIIERCIMIAKKLSGA
jgi:type I restriction enzyme, R subunit